MHMNNKEIHIRLPADVYDALQDLVSARQVNVSSVVRSALEDYFARTELEGIDAVLERLGTVESRIRSLRLDIEMVAELISFFIYHWFCYTPAVPNSEKRTLALEAQARHQKFLAQLVKRLRQGEFSLKDVLRHETPSIKELEKGSKL